MAGLGARQLHYMYTKWMDEWRILKPKDKRSRWGFVYLAELRSGGIKIGVSSRPWKRRSEIGARGILFSRFVYMPFALERGLHEIFQPESLGYEAFSLFSYQIEDAEQIIDYWQLMNPIEPRVTAPFARSRMGEPLTYYWEYNTIDPAFAGMGRW